MKFLKYVFYGIGGLIILILLVALFLPAEYNVQRSITIAASDSAVYAFTSDFNHRKSWDPWIAQEPTAKVTVSGPAGQVGSKWAWQGEQIGSGSMIITELNSARSIKSEIYFGEETQPGYVTWQFTPENGSTQVTWGIRGELDYPVGRIMGLLIGGFVGQSFETGLSNLKEVIEAQR